MIENVLTYLEEAAARFPDKPAVASEDRRYTYRELRDLSRRIGTGLRGCRGRAVGVSAGRSAVTLAYFFGVLYAGAFYVPLDPDMKPEKLNSILEDAGIDVILGAGQELREQTGFAGRLLQDTDFDGEVPAELPAAGKDTPIYMVYTSGSTGKPKGVLKSHGAVISYIEAFCGTFALSPDEIIGNQTPFFFDASAKDIYLMLKLGCTMEVLPTRLFTLPPELIDYLNEKKVTYASWVPTALSLVAQLNPFSLVKPTTLRRLFFVGEVMPMKHLNTWRRALPDIEYVNLYGSSEIAGICCWYRVEGEFADQEELPMGKPLSNCRIYLMDGDRIVDAPDQEGELYLVSDALALEYYHDPERTAASFRLRDFGEGPVRCFKTGDLAHYDREGNLVFAARTDFQIKHMGHRIELGEIEAVAGALPQIARCCCLYNAPRKKIVLFCQLTPGTEATGKELRSILREKLSSYMLPAKVELLEALPISQNGKIDRQALKALL